MFNFIYIILLTLVIYYIYIYLHIREGYLENLIVNEKVYQIPLVSQKISSKEFLIYAYIVKIIRKNFKHPLCGDLNGWLHYSLFIASKVFQKIRKDKKKQKIVPNTKTLSEVIFEVMLDNDKEYLKVLHGNTPKILSFHPSIPESSRENLYSGFGVQYNRQEGKENYSE